MNISARVPDYLGNKLKDIAQKTGRSESFYIRKALESFIEDREDYLLAVAALEESAGKPTYSLEEVMGRLGFVAKKKDKKSGLANKNNTKNRKVA